jgi:hypothetical protein
VLAVDWASLLDTLARVERLAAHESGLLAFGDGTLGGIFIERGRVCWVAAHGLQRRLSDLLRTHSRLDNAELERISERCRREGLHLGQTLVADGLLEPGELESALRRHSAECLVNLSQSPHVIHWASHVGRGYAPRFTFRAVDLLLDSMAVLYPALQREAVSMLSTVAGEGRRCVAFVFDGQLDALLPLAQLGDNGVQGMLAQARSLAAIRRAARELGTLPSFTLSTTGDGNTMLIWWREELLYAVSCPDRASLVAVTSQHLVCA